MSITIQIRLKDEEKWMKEALKTLKHSDDKRFQKRSESEICKMLIEETLKHEAKKMKK
jgi:hypothetical protein